LLNAIEILYLNCKFAINCQTDKQVTTLNISTAYFSEGYLSKNTQKILTAVTGHYKTW